MNELIKHQEDIYKCTKCGLCQSVCPVYEVTGLETTVSRGFFSILSGIIKGDLSFNKKTSKYLDMCLMCNACKDFCPSGINTEEIILSAKKVDFNKNGISFLKKFLIYCFCKKWILRTVSFFINFYKKLKINYISDFLPFKNIKIFNRFIRENVKYKKPAILKGNSRLKIVYFPGCVNNYINPSAKNAVKIVLEANGIDITIPDFECCGILARNYGDINTFRDLAKKNIKKVSADIDYLITDCASCGYAWMEYLKYFDIPFKIIDINEFLIKENLEIPDNSGFKAKVTYHDPCHLKRGMGVSKEPREILQKIPNVIFEEMEDADKCCGAAGTFCVTNSKISQKISDNKAKNIIKTDCDYVCTSCSGCTIGLYQGLIAEKSDIQVLQTIELVAENFY
ncbi:MAG: (Fe-S)-binding protein [Candidatus Gastranaerophilales bacterium]|nr:(Fe-S)-binding protein [Candidatus Gastranaerophilales bacterium]